MYCPKCGNVLQQGEKFCNKCGTAGIAREQVPPVRAEVKAKSEPVKKEKKKMPKKKKILIWVISSVSALIVAAAVLFVLWYLSPEQEMLRALQDGNYESAVKIYNRELDGDASDELITTLTEKIQAVKTDFDASKIDYEAAMESLDEIAEFGLEEVEKLLGEVTEHISTLNDSRITFAEAEELLAAGKYKDAMAKYALVWDTDPNYQTALAQISVAQEGYRNEVIASAKASAKDGNYSAALNQLKAALIVLPEDSAILTEITTTEDSYRTKVLEEAKTYADNGLYAEAIVELNKGLEILTNDEKLTAQLETYKEAKLSQEKSELLGKANKYVEDGDYPSAIKLLAGHEDDAEINSLYIKYCEEYEKAALAEADKLIGEKKFDEAVALLNKALTVLPNNESFTSKLQKAEAAKPVSLTSVTLVNGGWKWDAGSPKDPFGNDYSGSCNYVIFERNYNAKFISNNPYHYGSYVEYRLYGKYNHISGTLAPYTSIGEGEYAYIKIYADDILVYTSPEVRRKTDAFKFNVAISGAEYIKIEVILSGDSGALIMSNVELWP